MLSKAQISLIRNLKQKKHRVQEGLFVVEGTKMVQEALESKYRVYAVYSQKEDLFHESIGAKMITERQMSEITHFSSPSPALALVEMNKEDDISQIICCIDRSFLYLGLDSIRDPGNFGTIIRIADWFGISAIFASTDTVDLYNPKVIQATMGSVFRVPVHYVDLCKVVDILDVPIWGTAVDGSSVFETKLSHNGMIIIGNEAHGISEILQKKNIRTLTIPHYSKNAAAPESLNAAAATAIICAEFRRQYS